MWLTVIACYAGWMTPEQRDKVLITLATAGVIVLGVLAGVQYRDYRVAVRSHNLDVLYKSLTCDDLPLSSGSIPAFSTVQRR